VELRSVPDPDTAVEATAAPRQRWRLVLARAPDTSGITGRALVEAWEIALERSGLPVHRPAGRVRGRVAFGAPLQAGIAAERELADILLTDVIPVWRARECLTACVPDGWRLVDLYDVWLGGPPLAGQVAAADYRIELDDGESTVVAAAASSLLAARELPRERQKGTNVVKYDLRPLLAGLAVGKGSPTVLRVRTRFDPLLGTGRPDEVVAALEEQAGTRLVVHSIVRERLLLADELA
jgi:radical SAM-linked protein